MSPDRLSATLPPSPIHEARDHSRVSPRRNLGPEAGRAFRDSLPAVSTTPESAGTRGPDRARREARGGLPAPGQSAQDIADWVEYYRRHWEESFDKLDRYLKELQHKNKVNEIQRKEKKDGRKT